VDASNVIKKLKSIADPQIAAHSSRFFKSGPGEYGEGDRFLGIRVPEIRKQVKVFKSVSLDTCNELLHNPFHEIRLFAVLMLVSHYQRGDSEQQATIYSLYLSNSRWVNNWDLVDSSAHKIVGVHLQQADRKPLYQLAKSELLWDRRIAVIACYHFIKHDDYVDIINLAQLLLDDDHDLIHKAVGWMLREVGKRHFDVENDFLTQYYRQMPRTMLRYAIEKFPLPLRQAYLKSEI
jgi:3-methyladenine DNA glycosylase AlkD